MAIGKNKTYVHTDEERCPAANGKQQVMDNILQYITTYNVTLVRDGKSKLCVTFRLGRGMPKSKNETY